MDADDALPGFHVRSPTPIDGDSDDDEYTPYTHHARTPTPIAVLDADEPDDIDLDDPTEPWFRNSQKFLRDCAVVDIRDLPPDQRTCNICQEDYACEEEGERVKMLPCGHHFGALCLDDWLGPQQQPNRNTCPMCRRVLFDIDHSGWSDDEEDGGGGGLGEEFNLDLEVPEVVELPFHSVEAIQVHLGIQDLSGDDSGFLVALEKTQCLVSNFAWLRDYNRTAWLRDITPAAADGLPLIEHGFTLASTQLWAVWKATWNIGSDVELRPRQWAIMISGMTETLYRALEDRLADIGLWRPLPEHGISEWILVNEEARFLVICMMDIMVSAEKNWVR